MIAELSLELSGDMIECGGHVVGLRVREKRLPGDLQRGLDALEAVEGRVVLVDDPKVDPDGARLDPLERRELAGGGLAKVVVHRQTAPRERQLHLFSRSVGG